MHAETVFLQAVGNFEKDIKVVVKKLARNGRKTAIRADEWRRFPIDNDICTTLAIPD